MKKFLSYQKYFQSLSAKPIASGALIFDKKGRLLILQTTYRDGWIIPGGIVEKGESPIEACLRECREELGIAVKIRSLICLDYKVRTDKQICDDSLQMIFDGGSLSLKKIKKIKLNSDEHSAMAFVPIKQALTMLNPRLAKRIPLCIKARKTKTCVYLEGGVLSFTR